jgi:hypothetical protein
MRRIEMICFFIFYVSAITFSQQNNFETPEAVIQYFVNSLKTGNIDNVFFASPFNDDIIVNKINSREAIKYMDAILFQSNENLPPQYNAIIKYTLLGRYATSVKAFIFPLLLSETFPELAMLQPLSIRQSESLLDKYFLLLDPNNLETLELIRIDIYRPDLQFSERGMRYAEMQYKRVYNCDEKIEYVVLYRHEGRYYVGGIILLRYGSNWYIESLRGTYSNISGLVQVSGISEYLLEYKIIP